MKKKSLIIGIVLSLVAISAFLVYNYTFNSAHRDIAQEKAEITLSAEKIQKDFLENETIAITTYLDKVVEISGEITSVDGNEIILNDRVVIGFNNQNSLEIIEGTSVTMKGRCLGYDELLEMVKIDQATLIDKTN